MKRNVLFIALACIGVVLAIALLLCIAAEKNVKPARANSVPSPEFSPPYPPLPHHFNDNHGLQILC
jgi:hypothetical protein